jgi:hypothetical protein
MFVTLCSEIISIHRTTGLVPFVEHAFTLAASRHQTHEILDMLERTRDFNVEVGTRIMRNGRKRNNRKQITRAIN